MRWKRNVLCRLSPDTAIFSDRDRPEKSNPRHWMGSKIPLQGVGKYTFYYRLGTRLFCKLIRPPWLRNELRSPPMGTQLWRPTRATCLLSTAPLWGCQAVCHLIKRGPEALWQLLFAAAASQLFNDNHSLLTAFLWITTTNICLHLVIKLNAFQKHSECAYIHLQHQGYKL